VTQKDCCAAMSCRSSPLVLSPRKACSSPVFPRASPQWRAGAATPPSPGPTSLRGQVGVWEIAAETLMGALVQADPRAVVLPRSLSKDGSLLPVPR